MAERPIDTLSTLQHVLASAAKIAQELASDPLHVRYLELFGQIPIEDRETIVNVLEREIDVRNLSLDAPHTALSGIHVTKPNPNARLYFRVADNERPPYVSPEEIVQADIRAARVVHRSTERGNDFRTTWGPAMVSGLRQIEPGERETLRAYHRAMLELLEQSESK
jgi:hypothetical protein